jgi:hypothetical protein
MRAKTRKQALATIGWIRSYAFGTCLPEFARGHIQTLPTKGEGPREGDSAVLLAKQKLRSRNVNAHSSVAKSESQSCSAD